MIIDYDFYCETEQEFNRLVLQVPNGSTIFFNEVKKWVK